MDDTVVYLVRVWRGQRRFRATVRRVQDDAPQHFDAPEAVADYLRSQAALLGSVSTDARAEPATPVAGASASGRCDASPSNLKRV